MYTSHYHSSVDPVLWEEREADSARREIALQEIREAADAWYGPEGPQPRFTMFADTEGRSMEEERARQLFLKLSSPFPIEQVEVRPGAFNGDKTKAVALAYVDSRRYQERLDQVFGPFNWTVEYRLATAESVVCRLTIHNISKEDVGECEKKDERGKVEENQFTTMCAQAFKRACAAFGLGRYLYTHLPQVWADVKNQKYFENPRKVVEEMYKKGGIDKAYLALPEHQPVKAPGREQITEFIESGAVTTASRIPPMDHQIYRTFKQGAEKCQTVDDLVKLWACVQKEVAAGGMEKATLEACVRIKDQRKNELLAGTST